MKNLDKIAIVLPVRDGGTGRSERLKNCLNSWLDVSENLSEIYLIIDEDDIDNYLWVSEYHLNVKIVKPGITLMQKINSIAMEVADKFKYVGFVGDDIIFKTPWESQFINFLSTTANGLAYGDDLIQGERLPTHPCITSNMIKAVGFFGCPAVEHNYFDNYWLEIVRLVGEIKYFPEIIMEHMHPNIGKSNPDEISDLINKKLSSDSKKFAEYMFTNKILDCQKIKEYNDL